VFCSKRGDYVMDSILHLASNDRLPAIAKRMDLEDRTRSAGPAGSLVREKWFDP
jgi:hypothetical protein